MNYKIDYETAYKNALEENIKEVRDLVLSRDEKMLFKMSNYSKKFDIPFKLLEHKILQDNLYANIFIKDPSKQSLHQRTAAKYIESITEVVNFMQLPAAGSDACYVCNDGIVRKGDVNKGLTKSIDFYWEYDDCVYYAAHKYTKDEGGAQDNQFNDLCNFLINASHSKSEKIYYLAIGDGDYYKHKYRDGNIYYQSRLEYMNNKFSSDNAIALSTDELEDFLIKHSSNNTVV